MTRIDKIAYEPVDEDRGLLGRPDVIILDEPVTEADGTEPGDFTAQQDEDAILVALLLPAVQSAREAAGRAQSRDDYEPEHADVIVFDDGLFG